MPAARRAHGRSRSTLNRFATPRTTVASQPSRSAKRPQNATAPSLMLRRGSGTTRSSSTSLRAPSPLHSLHIPWGLLKEKSCGEISGKPIPQLGQPFFSEKMRSRSSPSTAAITMPSPSRSAVSTESVTRPRHSSPAGSLRVSRSTTIWTLCFFRFSRAVTSSMSCTSPSIRARENPRRRMFSRVARNSPRRFSRTGASRRKRAPAGNCASSSTISCAVCGLTARPHRGQWATPTRAKSTRR